MIGEEPEIVEPQLMISFVQYQGTKERGSGPSGVRFLDNRQFGGRLPRRSTHAEAVKLARRMIAAL